jgi:hypothetical protein
VSERERERERESMSHEQNLGQKQNKKIANKSFQNVAKFKYLEMTLTNQSCMHEDAQSRLNIFQNLASLFAV